MLSNAALSISKATKQEISTATFNTLSSCLGRLARLDHTISECVTMSARQECSRVQKPRCEGYNSDRLMLRLCSIRSPDVSKADTA
jgi:hypothetical protein